jgi:enolase
MDSTDRPNSLLESFGEGNVQAWRAFARSERMAKWNEVLRIEEALGAHGQFAGAAALPVRWR